MAITARCPGCGQTLSVQDQFAGMQGKCPTCNTNVMFPAAAPAGTTPAAPAPVTPVAAPAAAEAPFAAPLPPRGLDALALTFIGLGVAIFCYLLLLISPLLGWGTARLGDFESLLGGYPVITGTHFGDGRMLFCLSLLLMGLVALNFLDRRYLPQTVVLAGAFATFAFLMMLGRVGAGGAGVYVGMIAALGAAAACIWTAVRQPLVLETPLIPGGPSFFRTYGALLAAEAVAVVFGVLYWLLRAIFAGL